MTASLFTMEGTDFLPTELTVGPWSPDALHGGPVAALVTRAVEQLASPVPMDVARVTVELVRPVPLQPLTVTAVVSRPGRNVQLVDVSVSAGDVEVTRARALRMRALATDVPAERPDPPSPPAPDPSSDPPDHAPRTAFLGAVDLRILRGSWDDVGPATLWGRLLVPLLDGEEPTARQQAAAIADFGNGVSRIVDFETHLFINPDLTVSFSRTPEGPWIGLDAVTRLSPHGTGVAESLLFDWRGPVGRAVQSLLVTERPAPDAD